MKASFRRPWDRTRARDKQHSAWINYGHVSAFQTRPSTEGCMLCVGFETSWWFFSSKVERKAFMGQGWTCLGRWVFFFCSFWSFRSSFLSALSIDAFRCVVGFGGFIWFFAFDYGFSPIVAWIRSHIGFSCIYSWTIYINYFFFKFQSFFFFEFLKLNRKWGDWSILFKL